MTWKGGDDLERSAFPKCQSVSKIATFFLGHSQWWFDCKGYCAQRFCVSTKGET